MKKPIAALTVVAGLWLGQASYGADAASDGSVESLWSEQAQSVHSGDEAKAPLCTVDSFKQSALVQTGAWPGLGPFKGKGNELADANQNKLLLETNKNSRLTSAEMNVADKPKQLVKLQVAIDFLLESVGAMPAKIAEFNSQLNKSRSELTASSVKNPLNLTAGRYLVHIYPESAHKDLVNFVVMVDSKEAEAAPAQTNKTTTAATKPDQAPASESAPAQEWLDTSTNVVKAPARATKSSAAVQKGRPGEARSESAPQANVTLSQPDSTGHVTPAQVALGPQTALAQTKSTGAKWDWSDSTPSAATAMTVHTQPPAPVTPADSASPDNASTSTDTTGSDSPPLLASAVNSEPKRTAPQSQKYSAPSPGPDHLKGEFTALINRWQQIKRVAVSNKETAGLPEVLSGKALTRQAEAIGWLVNKHMHYEMSAKNVVVDRYIEMNSPDKFSVFAQVMEQSKLIDDAKNDVIKDTTNTYNVNYTIEKVDGHWSITDSALVAAAPCQPQSAAKTTNNASR